MLKSDEEKLMFLKRSVLFILMIGFCLIVSSGIGFAQETTEEDEEEVIPPDTTEAYIPANYQPCELVREFGVRQFWQSAQFVFPLDNKVIYASDSGQCKMLAFDYQGNLLFSFGGKKFGYLRGTDDDEEKEAARKKEYDEENVDKFAGLMEIAIDAKGNVYVADFGNNGIKIFTSEGKFVLLMPLRTDLQKKVTGMGASGVAVNSRGDICITDSMNARVQVNDLNGKYKYQIVKFKSKTGEELGMVNPGHPRINSLDELYVLDSLVCRVHRFNADGDYLGGFGYMGDGAGGFNAPNGLAIDKLDRVYVSDRGG